MFEPNFPTAFYSLWADLLVTLSEGYLYEENFERIYLWKDNNKPVEETLSFCHIVA